MNFSNPMQMMSQLMSGRIGQVQSQPQSPPQLNPVEFRQKASSLTKNDLIQFVQQARQQGISDNDIEQGLNFILNLK